MDNSNSNLENEAATKALDLDTILQEEVGKFGWFQVKNIILVLIACVFLGWNNNSFVFTAAKIPTRCHIPECDLEKPEFAPDWLLDAIPGTSLDSFDNCQRFDNASAGSPDEGVCLAEWFNHDQLLRCERHVYQNKDTIVYEFDLACDEWRRSLVGTIRLSATIFAQMVTGFMSDRWGRRTALVFNAFNGAWIGVLRSFSKSYTTFVIAEFVSSLFGSATFQSGYILMVELLSPEYRVFAGACVNTFFSVGLMTLGLIAWAVPNWKNLSRALFIPSLLTITYIWVMSESVRWYISKGNYKDTEKALKDIAQTNKKHISDKTLEILRKKAKEVKINKPNSQEKDKKQPSIFILLFHYKTILFRCFVTPLLWITMTLIFQGITLIAVDISGNKYVNYIAVAAAQIPGYWIALLLLHKFGRKPVLIGSYWLCAACLILFIFVPKHQYVLSQSVYMVSASCSGSIFGALYTFTAELYPTQYRHRLFGFSSMVGRLGQIFAPLTTVLSTLVWADFPFALFAACACVAGALTLLLPETRGMRLPDTMQEAAELGRKGQPSTATL